MHKILRKNLIIRGTIMAVAACFLIVGASSCGKVAQKATEKVTEKATGGKMDIDDNEFTIQTEDGELSAKVGGELPPNWPSDILPIADGFQIVNSQQMKIEGGTMDSVTTSGNGDPNSLLDLYVGTLEGAGAEIGMQTKSADGGMVIAEKDGNNYNVSIYNDGEETAVSLTITTSANTDD